MKKKCSLKINSFRLVLLATFSHLIEISEASDFSMEKLPFSLFLHLSLPPLSLSLSFLLYLLHQIPHIFRNIYHSSIHSTLSNMFYCLYAFCSLSRITSVVVKPWRHIQESQVIQIFQICCPALIRKKKCPGLMKIKRQFSLCCHLGGT